MKKPFCKTFTDSSGKRHYAYGNTLEEAIIARERMKKEIEENTPTSSTPFKLWAYTALETYKPNVSARYLYNMKNRLENHILPEIGHVPIGKVSPIMCQRILNSVSEYSRSHITKLAQELHFYFDSARRNYMIKDNPADDLIRPKGYQNKRRSLTEEERKHFLKVAKTNDFLVFELMLYCGCRPEEAMNVMYEDVTDIEGIKFLHIRGTKTACSDRLVPIPKEIYPKVVKRSHRGFCAVTATGNKMDMSAYRRKVKRLYREMNISMGAEVYRHQIIEPVLEADFVPYLFRHTYCTDLKKKGVDIRIAKNLMGHADIKTTANIYDHDDGETLILAARQMGL